ncbi:MAG: efflux RND transporter periplasmic adaptor subunit [Leptospiraceae bacterium]|nr:efflux RND transporter periplasmic adaptor subunit [Leptospiraceae bacterium]
MNTSMKNNSKQKWVFILGGLLLVIIATYFLCHKKARKNTPNSLTRPQVTDNGQKISFLPGSNGLQQIEVSKFDKTSEFISVGAPGRIIASVSSSLGGRGKIILFESPEINTLYANYQQSRNALNRSSKNLTRIKDMYANQVATMKDMIEAETDYGNARAEFSETEGKLRALGFNPVELGSVKTNTIILISDIPESDLINVSNGKEVKITFTSFPNEVFKGRSDAIGDNVDPLTRTVKVRVSMANKNNQFKPGMYAHIEFSEKGKSNAVIPYTSIVTVEGNTYVFVQTEPGVFIRRKILLGDSGIDKVGVIEGLRIGEDVVTKGAILLKGLSFGF